MELRLIDPEPDILEEANLCSPFRVYQLERLKKLKSESNSLTLCHCH